MPDEEGLLDEEAGSQEEGGVGHAFNRRVSPASEEDGYYTGVSRTRTSGEGALLMGEDVVAAGPEFVWAAPQKEARPGKNAQAPSPAAAAGSLGHAPRQPPVVIAPDALAAMLFAALTSSRHVARIPTLQHDQSVPLLIGNELVYLVSPGYWEKLWESLAEVCLEMAARDRIGLDWQKLEEDPTLAAVLTLVGLGKNSPEKD